MAKQEPFNMYDYKLNQEEDLRALEKDGLLQYDVPLSEIWDDALKIIPDDEITIIDIGRYKDVK